MERRLFASASIRPRSLFSLCSVAFLALVVGTAGGCSSSDDRASDEGDVEAAEDEIQIGDPHGDHDGDGLAPEGDSVTEEAADEEASADEDAVDIAAAAAARVASPVPGKKVTYPYGVKNPRYAAGYHTGDDYAAATGTKVVAVRAGKIRWSNSKGGAYGNWIGLDADNGRTYVYCHLSSRSVAAGATIKAGQQLGKVGATGNVTGPHLHFEDHPKGPFKYAQDRKPKW
ncbi:M23 family metallopeptidase [Pendulispora brunnea]|uniref:M23 family metallopeptidase n=1 Tax=Pendulispora brunnea TaxID=2905690 RepID=A0ABZ2K8A4_9BACT